MDSDNEQALLGMDVLSMGDFSTTHFNADDGQQWLRFLEYHYELHELHEFHKVAEPSGPATFFRLFLGILDYNAYLCSVNLMEVE